MLHACLYTICFVFWYTSWHFYAFSRTNLLTRCHSASSLFFAIFVFQKSYTGNILGIGWNKSRSSYFFWHETESKAKTEGDQGPSAPRRGTACPWPAPPGGVPPWPTSWRRPSAYIFPSTGKPKARSISMKPTASRHYRRCEIGRVQKLFSVPCRREESPSEAFFIIIPSSWGSQLGGHLHAISPEEEGSCQDDVVCSYNTTVEMFVSVQRACQIIAMAQRGPFVRRDVETPCRWVSMDKDR
jgi:hypothetical protein